MISNKSMTVICTYCIALTSILFWVWQFSVFVLGYSLTYKEPNIIIAACELLMSIISLVLLANYFRQDKMMLRVDSEPAAHNDLVAVQKAA